MSTFINKHLSISHNYAEAAYTMCVNAKCLKEALNDSLKFSLILEEFEDILIRKFSVSKKAEEIENFVSLFTSLEPLKEFVSFVIKEKDGISILQDIFLCLIKKISKSLERFEVIVLVPKIDMDISKFLFFCEKYFGDNFVYELLEDKKIIAGAVLIGENFMIDLSARSTLKKLSNIIFSYQIG